MSKVTVHSPYDGQPILVRSQDTGRALRDGGGKVFFLQQHENGDWYASRVRGGSEQEWQHAQTISTAASQQDVLDLSTDVPPADDTPQDATPLDRSGSRRSMSPMLRISLIVFAATLLGMGSAYLFKAKMAPAEHSDHAAEPFLQNP